MNLLIMNLFDAMDYVPTNSTYAIRIESPPNSEFHTKPFALRYPLQKSDLYTIVEYYFDDRTPDFGSGKLFDKKIAQRLLADFKELGLSKETLLVHCSRGKNRSPAVGIALNEIFNLGHDTKDLKQRYREANRHVYDVLLEVAKKL